MKHSKWIHAGGRCAHRCVRAVCAHVFGAHGTHAVICIHCAAYWVAGRIGWSNLGGLANNVAPPRFGFPIGSTFDLLSDVIVGDFGAAIRIAEKAAGIS